MGVVTYRKRRSPEQVQEDIRAGLAECLRFGTTLVGDIASDGASFDAVARAGLRGVAFFELIGLTEERLNLAMLKFLNWRYGRNKPATTCRKGISPHAPYSVQNALLCGAWIHGCTCAIHLGETASEADLLERQQGPLVDMLREMGIWQPSFEFCDWDLIVRASATEYPTNELVPMGVVSQQILLIHGNYLGPELPFGRNQSIVYCPRTHAAFGHPPHPFREFLKRGVRVCLGTDSLASNPDLDILAEARFVHAKYPDFPGGTLLQMVTLVGAAALGWADECGSLVPGKSADLVAVPLPDRDGEPHELLLSLECTAAPRRTMFRGEWRL
jgi:cytosine/adenosine deaminase-related metal-dependent hydrolase